MSDVHEQQRAELDALEQEVEPKCPLCGHEWRRHDPGDGRCDAPGCEGPTVCPCGRDLAWMQDAIRWQSRKALGLRGRGPTAPEPEDIPRRIRMDRWTPAERAIHDATQAVEDLPADERLTRAVVLLGEAQEAVADYVDGVLPVASPEPSEPEPSTVHERRTGEGEGERCPRCGSGPEDWYQDGFGETHCRCGEAWDERPTPAASEDVRARAHAEYERWCAHVGASPSGLTNHAFVAGYHAALLHTKGENDVEG